MSDPAPARPWTSKGKRPREWFRKNEEDEPAGTELGTDQHGQDGKTSKGRRWFSYEWWTGHHHQRASDGSYSTWAGTGKKPEGQGSKWASAYVSEKVSKAKAPTRHSRHLDAQQDYVVHTERLYNAAEAATNGNLVTPAGKAKGYGGKEFFAFSTAHRPSRRYMSDELRAWFGDGDTAASDQRGGGLMTFREWERRKKDDRHRDDRGPWTNRRRKKK